MFAVVRTGGKQYRVALGDKIVVEKMDGEAGDKVTLGDILLAGEGSDLKNTSGLTVGAEIIAQAKGDKVTVFKKRRRHNYRRKKGHRQQHTILRIVAIGDQKAEKTAKPAARKVEPASKPAKVSAAAEPKVQVDAAETANPAPDNEAAANPPKAKAAAPAKSAPAKAAPAKAAPAKPAAKASTKNAAPAKGAAQKLTKPKSNKAK